MKKGRLRSVACAVRQSTGTCSELYVCAGKEVTAHGVRAILDYAECEVKLRLCDMTLCVRGEGLSMKSYYGGAVSVCGEIREICFEG